jgi:hypothetical protein
MTYPQHWYPRGKHRGRIRRVIRRRTRRARSQISGPTAGRAAKGEKAGRVRFSLCYCGEQQNRKHHHVMAVPRVGIGAYSGHVKVLLARTESHTPGPKYGGRPNSECPSGLFSDGTGWPCRRTDTSQTARSRPSTNLKIKSHHQPLTLREHPLPCDGTEVA